MAKRNSDENKFIKIKPTNSTRESILSVAIINALTFLEVDQTKLPTRKEWTKLLKSNKSFPNICRTLEELYNVAIRPVPNIESISNCGIVTIDHPIYGKFLTFAYRDKSISEFDHKIINSGFGEDEIVIADTKFYERITAEDNESAEYYQIFIKDGEKEVINKEDLKECCEDCDRLYFNPLEKNQEYCLYDNKKITTNTQCTCCNKYFNSFKWKTQKEN